MNQDLFKSTIDISNRLDCNNRLRTESKGASWITKFPIAHRGLHGEEIAENSETAIDLAMKHHYPVEVDVQMISDGTIIVFHDLILDRLTSKTGKTKSLTKKDVKEMYLKNAKGKFVEDKIMTFEKFLTIVNGKIPILIEFKDKNIFNRELEFKVMSILHSYKGPFAIQSFNPMVLLWFKNNFPETPRGQLAGYLTDENISKFLKFFAKNVPLKSLTDTDFIAYELPYVKQSKVIQKLHNEILLDCNTKENTAIIGWTAKKQDDMTAKNNSVHGIIFEGFKPEETIQEF